MKRYPVISQLFLSLIVAGSTFGITNQPFFLSSLDYHPDFIGSGVSASMRSADQFGIKEIVPKEYLSKYLRWKDGLLATEYGRKIWNEYLNKQDFLLTIRVEEKRKFGAGTDDFEWDDSGRLVAATVTLGKDLDKGFPDPVYYPVMNSLSAFGAAHVVEGSILASTKLAHEMGHVSFTAKANSSLFRRQNKLMENYYKIFLMNGFNTRDPRLMTLEKELGAQPIAIWEDREYWSEVGAMHFLVERIGNESFYCSVLNKVKRNVADHARNYQDRFELSTIGGRSTCSD